MRYHLIVCGGTFDRWHAGHALFLRSVLSLSDKVLLGITSDQYILHNKKSSHPIQSFAQRKKSVEEFLAKEQAQERVTIAAIDTVFYPEEWESMPIEAIAVTEETEKGAAVINNDREQRGLFPLPVVIIPIMLDDHGEKLASTHIREGKMNTQGISYIQPSWFAKDLFLPEVEKQWFKEPFGNLHPDMLFITKENPDRLVTVGDAVTQDCNQQGINQKLSVIDFAIQRKKMFGAVTELGFTGDEMILHADNPPSHMTTSLFTSIMQGVTALSQQKRIVLIVNGEEDLAVIPLVLALPLDFVVIYGQPNRGIVRLEITQETKDKAYALLQHFIFANRI